MITRKKIEEYLGKMVEIKLFDGTIFIGYLREDTSGYSPKNKWYCTFNPDSNIMFRVSHIKSIKALEVAKDD